MFSSVGKVASMNNRLVIEYEEGRESMEPVCEFCGAARAVVYCKSDSARLCLQCDGYVHSANSLSRRHLRSLLCDKCNSQPAMIRCLDEKLSICQGCDWSPNGCSGLGHRLKVLTCYTGCPTIAEFSRIWSWVLEPPSSSSCDAGWRALSGLPFSENCVSNCLEQRNNEESFGMVNTKLNELEPCPKLEPWIMPTAMIPPNLNCTAYCRDQAPYLPEESNKPKAFSNCKCPGIQDDEYLCEGLNIDNVQLSLESGDEIFGCSQVQTKNQLEDVGNDCILMERNLSVTESNGPIENALEASSSGHHDSVAFQSSCVAVSANVMQAARHSANCFHMNPSCDRNINLGFPTGTGQVHSSLSLSLSNMTGESSAANYQDCGLSPVFLTCESPWESSLEASCPQARDKAKMRYNEKKKTRTFGKQIRYASCKARADTRKRVKGRFVKAGEAYD